MRSGGNNRTGTFRLLKDIKVHYKKSSLKWKQKLHGSIFTENLFFEVDECRTARINDVLCFIMQIDNKLRYKKKRAIFNEIEIVLSSGVGENRTLVQTSY